MLLGKHKPHCKSQSVPGHNNTLQCSIACKCRPAVRQVVVIVTMMLAFVVGLAAFLGLTPFFVMFYILPYACTKIGLPSARVKMAVWYVKFRDRVRPCPRIAKGPKTELGLSFLQTKPCRFCRH